MRKLWTIALLGATLLAGAVEFRIETEKFPELREWRYDRTDQAINRTSLWAGGNTRGEANAISADFVAPEPGKYFVWIRTLDFGEKYRRTQVRIDGKNIGTFGDEGEKGPHRFAWKRSLNSVKLGDKKFTVLLTPQSPHSRVDSLIFTTDSNFTPPESPRQVEEIPEIEPEAEASVAASAPVAKPAATETASQPAAAVEKPKKSKKLPPLPAVCNTTRGEIRFGKLRLELRGKDNHFPILLFHGGRPWTATDTAMKLATCGGKVTLVNSAFLDGLGGASIKNFLSDKVEPKAADGITPGFARLGNYRAVMFCAIPMENMEKIFTPERIAKLREYLENGGVVVFDNNVPKSLQEFIPVDLASRSGLDREELMLLSGTRPEAPDFAFLPEKFPVYFTTCRNTPLPGAQVLSRLIATEGDGETLGALIAEKSIGKGKVIYLGFSWSRQSGLRQFWTWAYGKRLIAAVIGYATHEKEQFDTAKLYDYSPVPPPQMRDEVSVTITDPAWGLADNSGVAAIDGNVATLPGGAKLNIAKSGVVSITYPGAEFPALRYAELPKMRFFAALEKLTSDTSEAVDTKVKYQKINAEPWNFLGARVDGNTVILSFSNSKGEFDWQFKAGTLDIDGRHYDAVADRVIVKKYADLLQTISFNYDMKLGKTLAGHRAKRLACYATPRGWADMDFSGKEKADTGRFNFFGTGQPFSYLVAPEAIFATFVEAPILTELRQTIGERDKFVREVLDITVGRRKAPISTQYAWHAFSAGPERGHNDYLGLYQFMRHHLRKVAGLKEIPSVPTASHTNTMFQEQSELAIETAGKLGFQQFHLQLCPSPIESIPRNVAKYQFIRKHGMLPRPWTAADYAHGDGEAVFQHKDYFLRNPDGTIYSYFGKHPVLNFGNPDTVKWYTGVIDEAIKNGIGAIYTDMGGALTSNIDFSGEESGTGLDAIIPIYRYYHQNNIPFGIEGQTPLGLNSFWYRRTKYAPFAGNEFSLIGSLCYSDFIDDIDLDYFRMAMYDCFMLTHVEGYALDFERRPHEKELIERTGKLNPKINEALQVTGMPFIREIPCGTTWAGENGAAVFCYDPVKKLTVNYQGKEQVFTDVPGDSIIILRK